MAKAAPAEQLRLLDLARLDSEITKLKRTITEASRDAEVDAAQARLAESGTSLAEVARPPHHAAGRAEGLRGRRREGHRAHQQGPEADRHQRRFRQRHDGAVPRGRIADQAPQRPRGRRTGDHGRPGGPSGRARRRGGTQHPAIRRARRPHGPPRCGRRRAEGGARSRRVRRKESAATFDEGLFTIYERIRTRSRHRCGPALPRHLGGQRHRPGLRATSRKSRRPRPTKSSSAPTPERSWSAAANGAHGPVGQNPRTTPWPIPRVRNRPRKAWPSRAAAACTTPKSGSATSRRPAPPSAGCWSSLATARGSPGPTARATMARTTTSFLNRVPTSCPVAHQRCAPGVNHLAFAAGSRKRVDGLAAAAIQRGFRLLFADAHPFAGGPQHYAAYLADPDGFEFELVAERLGRPGRPECSESAQCAIRAARPPAGIQADAVPAAASPRP